MTVKVAMIGVGAISGIYLKNISERYREVELIGVCDLIRERAEAAREQYGVPKLYEDMAEAFRDPEVDLVLNLTRPSEHYEVTRQALMAGKHVYSEKPLGVTMEEGSALFQLARQKNLLLGGAPDTFMGAGIQTCRKLIDDGVIGDVVGAGASMMCRGHETWHPDPEFYYKRGGGPMMDMGPYYVTALVNLMGAARRVSGMSKAMFPTRLISSQPHFGERIDVDVPTFVTGQIEFASGAVANVFTTFDVYYPTQAKLEIYGTLGTMICPDPNYFDGPVQIYSPREKALREMPLMFDYSDNSRGMGLADMADAILSGRDFRADSTQQMHVLDILTAFERSGDAGCPVDMVTPYERGLPMAREGLYGLIR